MANEEWNKISACITNIQMHINGIISLIDRLKKDIVTIENNQNMKFKRDYKITIEADANDIPYWYATHKGERKIMELEDYKIVLSMIDSIRNGVCKAIDSLIK